MSRRKNPNLKSSNVVDEYTQEMILEMKRCAVDPVYFAMNYVYIKHPVRGRIKFTMFDYQIKMMNKYKNNKHNIVLSARQTGKTETSCAYLLWFSIFHDDKTILVVSNKATNAMEIISKIQYAYEELPNWLKPGIDENSWNKHECKFDNKSRIVSTTTSKDSGRGLPLSLVYCDEFAFVPTNIQEEFWASILPTLSTGGSIIISSTPNGDTDKFSTLWRGAELNTNEFSHGMTFVPWYAHPERDEAFKEKMIGLLGERKWKQEYECQFLTSEQTLIDQYAINQREAYINANITKAFELMGIPFWNKINPSSSYIVSCDPATGSGEDYSVIQVYEFPSLEQVCEWRNNAMDIPQLYNVLKNLLRFLARFTNNIYFSVENNGIGQGVLALYQADDNFPEQAFLISDGGKNLGITTTVKNKIPSCMKLKQMFESGIIKINSKIVLTEMKNFVRLENTYKAKAGATDDAISACLLLIKILEHMADSDANAYDKIYSQSLDAFKDEFDAMGEVDGDDYSYAPSFMII